MRAPVRFGWCVLGWVLASALFVGSVALWYHGQINDLTEGAVPALAVEQGSLSCAYPGWVASSVPPLVPLVDAALLSAGGVNHPFPPTMRGGCSPTPAGSPLWREVAEPFVIIALIEWLTLLGGFVVLLRSSGRGRTRWEMAGVCLIAITPATAATIAEFLHPEDLIAMGLVLMAIAATLRRRFVVAGLCIGLACCSKQFALLAAVPLLIAVPRGVRARFTLSAVAVATAVLLPFGFAMGRGMVTAILGSHATPASTGTLVDQLRLAGPSLVTVSRLLPFVVAGAVALLARHRLGPRLLEPVPLLALVGIALALRLVFEVNLYSYYFMALGVVLLTIDIVGGRLRIETLGWVVIVGGFFPPVFEPLQLVTEHHTPLVQAVVLSWGIALAAGPLYRCAHRPAAAASPVAELTSGMRTTLPTEPEESAGTDDSVAPALSFSSPTADDRR
jgi:hypothetical protein